MIFFPGVKMLFTTVKLCSFSYNVAAIFPHSLTEGKSIILRRWWNVIW